ncbi:UNVERIFIED_CONTAM: hypothetical protein FKN15_002845 [Acipenser sinensis]
MCKPLPFNEKVDWSKFVAVNGATAHPHYDPNGTSYNMGNSYGRQGTRYNIIRVPPQKTNDSDTLQGAQIICSIPPQDGAKPSYYHSFGTRYNIIRVPPQKTNDSDTLQGAQIICSIPPQDGAKPSYYHSFGMTENYVVFIEQPIQLNLLEIITAKMRGKCMSDGIKWEPDHETVIHVASKQTGQLIPVKYYAKPLAMFHQINAFEDQGCIVLDLCFSDEGGALTNFKIQNLHKSGQALDEVCAAPRCRLQHGHRTEPQHATLQLCHCSEERRQEEPTDNSNVHYVKYMGDYYVSTETNYMHKVDPETLASMEKVDWSKFVAVNGATAHPHYDPNGTSYNMGNSYGRQGTRYNIIRVPPQKTNDSDTLQGAQIICSIPPQDGAKPSYYHSFGMTENYVVFIEQPIQLNLLEIITAKMRGKCMSDGIKWEPDHETVIHVASKQTGQLIPVKYYAKPLAMFHQINAFEDQGCIVLDLCFSDEGGALTNFKIQNLHKSGQALDEMYNTTARTFPRRFVLPLAVDSSTATGQNLNTLPYSSATAVKRDDRKITKTFLDLYSVDISVRDDQGSAHLLEPSLNAKCGYKLKKNYKGDLNLLVSLMACHLYLEGESVLLTIEVEYEQLRNSSVSGADVFSFTCAQKELAVKRNVFCEEEYIEDVFDYPSLAYTMMAKHEELLIGLRYDLSAVCPEVLADSRWRRCVLVQVRCAGADVTVSVPIVRTPASGETVDLVFGIQVDGITVSQTDMDERGFLLQHSAQEVTVTYPKKNNVEYKLVRELTSNEMGFNITYGPIPLDYIVSSISIDGTISYSLADIAAQGASVTMIKDVNFQYVNVFAKYGTPVVPRKYIGGTSSQYSTTPSFLFLNSERTEETVKETETHTYNRSDVVCTATGEMKARALRISASPAVDLHSLSLRDPRCGPSEVTDNLTSFEFTVNTCGTTKEVHGDYVVYDNEISSKVTANDNTTRHTPYKVTLLCQYLQTDQLSLELFSKYKQSLPKPALGQGEFKLSLDIMRGKDCWGTLEADPSSTLMWPVIKDSCEFKGDKYKTVFHQVKPTRRVQLPGHYKRFDVKMFTFVDMQSKQLLDKEIGLLTAEGTGCRPRVILETTLSFTDRCRWQ